MERAIPKPKVDFSTIGNTLQMTFSFELLPARDKCALLNALMDHLGLTEAIQREPNGCARFQELWKEMMDRNWR